MTLLVYGIMKSSGSVASKMPPGIAAQPVVLSTHGGLAAAYSSIPGADLPLTLTDIQVFNTVIQWLCDHTATVPLRYGSTFTDHRTLRSHLHSERERYEELIRQIDGCVEMGIRIEQLPSNMAVKKAIDPEKRLEPVPSGLDYLRQRRRHYANLDGRNTTVRHMVSTCKEIFRGLFKACAYEIVTPTGKPNTATTAAPLNLSLYFLIPRHHRASFVSAYKTAESRSPHRLRISGPWPPYNFVTGSRPPHDRQDERHGKCA